ncbi:MAG: alpha-mannosidase [Chloroflexi bacterium]|nr:alpha-mannosidase [Chloroflexota bacterium]
MQKHLEITRQRVQAFKGQLAERLYTQTAPIKISTYVAPGRITFDEAMRGNYRPCQIGELFRPLWSTHWFKLEIYIPNGWQGQEVHLRWDSSSEACVWQEGVPLQGLTGSARTGEGDGGDRQKPIRTTYRLTKSAQGGEAITLYIEAAMNGMFGLINGDEFRQLGLLRQADIATFDRAVWDLLWDYTIVADMANHLPHNTPRGGQALYAANAIVNQVYPDDPSTWPAGREIAAKFLSAQNGDGQHNLSAIGHAHIDTAWLWPLAETMRKCYRTFSTTLCYMQDYPDYKFVCSQAQQFAWMREQQPALYEKIKAAAQEGRFIPAGGSWVEPDCNLPSGESLVRQFLYGQRFFQQEFGITCREFWLPDTFGYPAALPQIMRGVGIEYFLTQKLSWNQFNKPASSTFIWEGLDGSQVLVHFPPADTYNANASVQQLLYNVTNFKDHERANESYYLFGYGDGGGGPTEEMLEQLSRVKDVDGLPRVEIRTPQEFFERCKADAKDLPVWVGELYFELHRGTYTTQARNKLHNRRAETLMHNLEFLAAMAHATQAAPYPSAEIERLWKLILLNQFHDIIPGSSIHEVYEDSERDYREIFEGGEKLLNETIAALIPPGDEWVAINTVGIFRPHVVVEIPDKNTSTLQKAASGNQLAIVSVHPMGWSRIDLGEISDDQVQVSEVDENFILENKHLTATFRKDGHLISLFDKTAKREAIEQNKLGNHFVLFDDHPNDWEAWDMDVFHLEKRAREYESNGNMRILETGPLRASLEFEITLSERSKLKQVISLDCASGYLEFSTEVEWHENRKFLKVEFPLNVRSQYATYETQYGYIQRPTHFNTTWDIARFEVCAHRWVDLSEPSFGVALLNDCKYGYAVHANIMRLSLLRSPKSPDDKADMGYHLFRYALYPHQKSLWEAGITLTSQIFNTPLIIKNAEYPFKDSKPSYFATEWDAIHLDTIKKAEDSDAIIVRLYEANGERGHWEISTNLPLKKVFHCNLLEEAEEELEWEEGMIPLDFTPFQIITLKLELDV